MRAQSPEGGTASGSVQSVVWCLAWAGEGACYKADATLSMLRSDWVAGQGKRSGRGHAAAGAALVSSLGTARRLWASAHGEVCRVSVLGFTPELRKRTRIASLTDNSFCLYQKSCELQGLGDRPGLKDVSSGLIFP